MSFLEKIKIVNKKASGELVGTEDYFRKSPSSMLLKQAIEAALGKYSRDKSVVDAGAGRLAYRDLIKNYAKKYTSFDFKQTHPKLDKVTSVEKIDFREKSFEVVFCSQVLEHVPRPWVAMGEFYRVLKPKGMAIITVPMMGYIHNAPYDFYRYTRYGLETLAQDAGFQVVEIKPLGGFFCFLGYIRSTILMPIYAVPVIGKLIFEINVIFSCIDIMLDRITKNDSVFPLDYMLIVRK